jgi:hypothetical protein
MRAAALASLAQSLSCLGGLAFPVGGLAFPFTVLRPTVDVELVDADVPRCIPGHVRSGPRPARRVRDRSAKGGDVHLREGAHGPGPARVGPHLLVVAYFANIVLHRCLAPDHPWL